MTTTACTTSSGTCGRGPRPGKSKTRRSSPGTAVTAPTATVRPSTRTRSRLASTRRCRCASSPTSSRTRSAENSSCRAGSRKACTPVAERDRAVGCGAVAKTSTRQTRRSARARPRTRRPGGEHRTRSHHGAAGHLDPGVPPHEPPLLLLLLGDGQAVTERLLPAEPRRALTGPLCTPDTLAAGRGGGPGTTAGARPARAGATVRHEVPGRAGGVGRPPRGQVRGRPAARVEGAEALRGGRHRGWWSPDGLRGPPRSTFPDQDVEGVMRAEGDSEATFVAFVEGATLARRVAHLLVPGDPGHATTCCRRRWCAPTWPVAGAAGRDGVRAQGDEQPGGRPVATPAAGGAGRGAGASGRARPTGQWRSARAGAGPGRAERAGADGGRAAVLRRPVRAAGGRRTGRLAGHGQFDSLRRSRGWAWARRGAGTTTGRREDAARGDGPAQAARAADGGRRGRAGRRCWVVCRWRARRPLSPWSRSPWSARRRCP